MVIIYQFTGVVLTEPMLQDERMLLVSRWARM